MSLAKKLFHFKTPEILRIFSRPTFRYFKQGLQFFVAPTALEHGRLLVVTPRKAGNAVTRNKIRRRLRAIFRQHDLHKKPYDIIVRVHKEATTLSFEQLQQLMLKTVDKIESS